MRWTLSQLCKKAEFIPETIQELFETKCEPSTQELLVAIKIVLQRLSHVLILIDAVDESQNREQLAVIIRKPAEEEDFRNIKLIVLSRDEVDLARHLDAFGSISMSNEYVDEAIGIYIQQQVDGEPNFEKWSEEFRTEIVSTLQAGAKGM